MELTTQPLENILELTLSQILPILYPKTSSYRHLNSISLLLWLHTVHESGALWYPRLVTLWLCEPVCEALDCQWCQIESSNYKIGCLASCSTHPLTLRNIHSKDSIASQPGQWLDSHWLDKLRIHAPLNKSGFCSLPILDCFIWYFSPHHLLCYRSTCLSIDVIGNGSESAQINFIDTSYTSWLYKQIAKAVEHRSWQFWLEKI